MHEDDIWMFSRQDAVKLCIIAYVFSLLVSICDVTHKLFAVHHLITTDISKTSNKKWAVS
jgi:hypothetical protein